LIVKELINRAVGSDTEMSPNTVHSRYDYGEQRNFETNNRVSIPTNENARVAYTRDLELEDAVLGPKVSTSNVNIVTSVIKQKSKI
jgi:hypothetical protein